MTVLTPGTGIAAGSADPAGRRSRRRGRARTRWTGWGFIAPFLLVFLFALVAPIGYAVYLSLFQDKLIGGNRFVGFANYTQALHDAQFWTGFAHVALFLAVQVPVMLILALGIAFAIDSARLHWTPLYRLSIFLPYAVPSVVGALMWGFLYGTQFGLLGEFDHWFHTTLPDPLGSTLLLPALGNVVTWEYVGYNMLIFYSALRVIPQEIYEAAELDNASGRRIIWHIKLPALRPAILVATVFSIIGSFQLFTEPAVLFPIAKDTIGSAYTPNWYAYNLSFDGQEYNYSATIAIVMGLLTVIVAYVVQRVGQRNQGA